MSIAFVILIWLPLLIDLIIFCGKFVTISYWHANCDSSSLALFTRGHMHNSVVTLLPN